MALFKRRVINQTFGEDAVLITRGAGERNYYGEWEPADAVEIPIKTASASIRHKELRTYRIEDEVGSRSKDIREFWFHYPDARHLRPGETDGDVIRYYGVEYRIYSLNFWPTNDYVAAIAIADQGI